ncbi:MAG: hypothetical protein AB7O24_30815 [Kofleriaceae bacterium]
MRSLLYLTCAASLAASTLAGCHYASDPDISPGDAPPVLMNTDFPCDVAEVLATCWGCHAETPRNGAPMPLTTRDHLAAISVVNATMTIGQRSVARLRDDGRPMPPPGSPRPSDAAIDGFAAWINAGMPEGTCGEPPPPPPPPPDAGMPPPDAGPAPTVCSSGETWQMGTPPGPDMNPGRACRKCHLNAAPDRAFYFMGTVYPTLHEQDRCHSNVPTGTRVEILDVNGQVALTMQVRAKGNFFSDSVDTQVPLPFTARVVGHNGTVKQRNTPQMNGDCNSCHTEQGMFGAPGRILLPM